MNINQHFPKSNIVLFAAGRLISELGTSIFTISIMLFILDHFHLGSIIGIFALMTTLPRLVILPFSGLIGDLYNRKIIMTIANVLSAIACLVLLLVVKSNKNVVAAIFALQVVSTICDMFFRSSSRAIIPELVTENNLIRFNSLIRGVDSTSAVLGPILGSIIYSMAGLPIALIINAASFILSAITLILINYKPTHLRQEPVTVKKSVTMMKEGFDFIFNYKGLSTLIIFYMLYSTLSISLLTVMLPFAYKKVFFFTNFQFGLLEASFIVGLLLGSLYLGIYSPKMSIVKLIKNNLSIEIILFFLLAITFLPVVKSLFGIADWRTFAIYSVILITLGVTNILWDTPIESNLQKIIPTALQGRVMSSVQFLFGIGIPIGQAACGFLLDFVPIKFIYFGIAILNTVIIVQFLKFFPSNIIKHQSTKSSLPEENPATI